MEEALSDGATSEHPMQTAKVCIECGKPLPLGRTNPPFCSAECKDLKKAKSLANQPQKPIKKVETVDAVQCSSCLTQASAKGSAHCEQCKISRKSDVFTLITADGLMNFSSIQSAEAAIEGIQSKFPGVSALLDLHNVTDTTDISQELGLRTAVISFVGKHSATRYEAVEDIKARISSGQILFGCLCFARGERLKNSHGYLETQELGSKSWFCRQFKEAKVFVDDSEDHVESVRIGCPHLKSLLFDPAKSGPLHLFLSKIN